MSIECGRCLYRSGHPFGFSVKDGLCTGCITHDEKAGLSSAGKDLHLLERIELIKKKFNKSPYHCVIPVIGDAEDYYVVSRVLKLGLNPLVVCVNDYFKNDIGWHNLQNLVTHFDLDSFIFNPDLNVYKELVRTSLRKHNHILWPFISLHTSFPVHVALERRIPLVIWGQNQSVEQVGKFSHYDSVEMSNWGRHEHDLFGVSVDKMIGNGAQLEKHHLNYYIYPEIKRLHQKSVKGIYLSNYYSWDPLLQNQKAIAQGFIAEQNKASFDPYERAGSSVYYGIHDLLKYKRLGYRKVRDQLVREIRHNRISKIDAIVLEESYTQSLVDVSPFFKWLEVTKTGMEWFVQHRLSDVAHLIGDEGFRPPAYKGGFSSLLGTGNKPKEFYIAYSKQLYL